MGGKIAVPLASCGRGSRSMNLGYKCPPLVEVGEWRLRPLSAFMGGIRVASYSPLDEMCSNRSLAVPCGSCVNGPLLQ